MELVSSFKNAGSSDTTLKLTQIVLNIVKRKIFTKSVIKEDDQ